MTAIKHVINTAVGFLLPTAKCKAHEMGIKMSKRLSQLDLAILIQDRLYPGTSRILRSGVKRPVVRRLTVDCWRCGSVSPEVRRLVDAPLACRCEGWAAFLMGAPPERTAVSRGSSERATVSLEEWLAISFPYVEVSPIATFFSFTLMFEGSYGPGESVCWPP